MTSHTEIVVHLDRITKRFGDVVAVDDLDMQIMAGEFVTFLGPSGCGKSTTLRIAGGFERPNKGRVVLAGEDVTALPPNKRDVNMVFQDYALFPHMTVAGNMAFGLELKGESRSAIERRLDELLALLELEPLRERTPDQLSGGQRQRVALARALARDPRLLLLDEPLAALDAKLRAQVQLELKDIQKRTGKTFFFVTHDQDEALTMSDRIVVMNHGRVEQSGTPEELYHHPASRFVAEFIGETNFFSGAVRSIDGQRVAIDWQGVLLHAAIGDQRPTIGQSVSAALRPERIRLHRDRPTSDNALEGRLVKRVFKGSRTVLDIAVGESAVIRAFDATDVAERINPGRLWLSWEPESLALLRD
ncbi:MAG: ABC transporter ATP-binding protein [Alphaproteobacteria bacterium]|nr:ABC transporter ATP-binding protein [Alphaproteobacteria bacterium]